MSANSDLVDDLVQETWVRVIRGLSRLRDPARFSPWLFTVARRAFVDQLRRDYREPDLEPLSGQEKATGSEPEDLIGLLNASDVLADLAPVDREAVLLHHVFGFQINEIAGIAEVPQGTVKSRLHRGRQQLKSYIEKGDNQL